jgi:hypothetical protein
MSLFTNPNRIPENYGLKIAGGLIAYFLLMQVIGFGHLVELRVLNLFILIAGVFFALRKFKRSHEDHLNYFRALATGVATSTIGSVIFAAFLFGYMMIDESLLKALMENDPITRHLNPYMIAFIVGLEGVFSGLLVTFILINYVSTDDINDPIGESK